MKNFTNREERIGARHRFPVLLKVIFAVSILLSFCLCAGETQAQNTAKKRTVTGTVTDKNGGIIGANVLYRNGNTVIGVATGANGVFSIEIPNEKGGILQVSFLGYKTQNIELTARTDYFIELVEDAAVMEDIVVVGYGVQKKESVVGAITQVRGETLVQSGMTNVTNAISGKLSGVTTIQRSGQPGSSDAEIVIRGLSSFADSSPLVMVDGVERDFSAIDPNEISSISVLKDASATAVFGAKGANGVILVTTKRGTAGSKPRMNYSFSMGMSEPINVISHVDAYTTMSLLNVARMNDQQFSTLVSQEELNEYANPSTRLNSIKYPDVNWFKELTKPFAPSYNGNFTLQGGTRFVRYFASLGYTHESSLFKSYKKGNYDTSFYYNRFNYRSNLDFSLTPTTVLSFNLGGDVGIQNKPIVPANDDELWKYIFGSSTTKYPLYYPAWVMEEVPDPDYPGLAEDRLIDNTGDVTRNPYFVLTSGKFNQYSSSKLFSDIILDQKLDFITPGLSVKAKFSLSTYYKYNSLTTQYSQPDYVLDFSKIGTGENPWSRTGGTGDIYTPNPPYINVGGLVNDNNKSFYYDVYYDLSLNYSRTFGRHTVTGLALINRSEQDRTTQFPYYNEALVGRITYDFSHKYLFEFNLGYTGSERFAPGNRFGFFPSAAVGWVVSEEKFFRQAVPWISRLKLRYSQGLVGSDYANNRWLYISEYSVDGNGYIKEDKIANSVAQWEEAMKRDVGIELGFLNNNLMVEVDLFDEKRYKMLISADNSTPMWVGNTSKELNKGQIKKHGFEVEVDYNKQFSSGWGFYVSGNFGFNENRIIVKDDAPYALSHKKVAGTPIGAQVKGAYLTGNGYFTTVDDIHSNIAPIPVSSLVVGDYKFLDYNSDGKIDQNDLTRMEGSTQPPIMYGFGAGVNWKGLEVSVLFQGYAGKWVNYNQMYEYGFYKGNYKVTQSVINYWAPDNLDGTHGALHYTSGYEENLSWSGLSEDKTSAGYAAMIKGKSWRRADFLRLKDLYIGYTLNSRRLKEWMGVQAVKFYITGSNLLTFTPLLEGDPENTYLTYGTYPQLRTYKFGLQVSF